MSTSPRRALIVIDVQNEYVDGRLLIRHPPVEARSGPSAVPWTSRAPTAYR